MAAPAGGWVEKGPWCTTMMLLHDLDDVSVTVSMIVIVTLNLIVIVAVIVAVKFDFTTAI